MPDAAKDRRNDARAIWEAGVAAVRPERVLPRHLVVRDDAVTVCGRSLPRAGIDRVLVVGAGKAGAEMAVAVEDALGPDLVDGGDVHGCVAVPAGARVAPRAIALHVARQGHENLPTAAGIEGALRILELVRNAGPRDVVLALISGGGSALLPLPAAGLTLEDKIAATSLLARAGADVAELNVVRKHLSAIKGGRLAEGFAGRLLATLVISDVIGDPLDAIASGPTVPDPSTFSDALAIVMRHDLLDVLPPAVRAHLESGVAGAIAETPKSLPESVTCTVVANARLALDAMRAEAEARGWLVLDHGDRIAGDTREVASSFAEELRALSRRRTPGIALISGGETTVRLPEGHGLGGRNQEMCAAIASELGEDGLEDVAVLCAGSDGEDGPTDAAGAILDAELLRGARESGCDLEDALARHDTHAFHERAGSLIRSGWTGTNVMDLRVMLLGDPGRRGASPSGP